MHKKIPEGLYCITSGGNQFIISLGDNVIGREIFVNGNFDMNKLVTAMRLISAEKGLSNTPKIIIDVGANIGTIGIPAVSTGMFEKAICIEPVPLNFSILRANVILNNLEDKIDLRNIALSDKPEGMLKMTLSKDNYGDHRVVQEIDGEGDLNTVKVDTTTLDSIVDGSPHDYKDVLVWMDTQGYEGWILKGSGSLIKNKVPMVLEFWPWGMEQSNGFRLIKEALQNYSGFYDLNNPGNLYSISDLDDLYLEIGCYESKFTDILVF
jgi:FkbM family methyltransferase